MGSNSDSSDNDDVGEQIRVSLILSAEVQDRSLEIPSDSIAVPASVGRKGLAAVVNTLLGRKVHKNEDDDSDAESDDDDDEDKLPALPFEFVLQANNRLLRGGVEREARRYGLSLEKAVALTYFPAQEAPELAGESEHVPDWISCLSYVNSSTSSTENKKPYLSAAAYDGSLRVYHPQQNSKDDAAPGVVLAPILNISTAHKGSPIKCLDAAFWGDQEQRLILASGAMDHTLNVHVLDTSSNAIQVNGMCQDGHSSALASLDLFAASSNKLLLASGDWDGTLCLWDLTTAAAAESSNEQHTSKKKKTSSKSSSPASTTITLNPTVSIPQAHSSPISGLSWGNVHKRNSSTNNASPHETLVTGSWDHSLKVWDVERQENVLSLNGARVVACLDTSHHSEGFVATGHPDCSIRLWDVRTSTSGAAGSMAVSDKTFRPSHKEWVSAVQWSPRNPYHLASTSHDGTVKVWDIRTSLPLHTVRVFGKTEKGLCMAYGETMDDHTSFFLGGTDCVVKHLTTNC